MTAFEQALFCIDLFAAILSFLALINLKRNREFERSEYEPSLQSLLFGAFFLFFASLTHLVHSAITLYHDTIIASIPQIDTYLDYFLTITNIALLPLFAVCVFVAILILWHTLPEDKHPKKQEEALHK